MKTKDAMFVEIHEFGAAVAQDPAYENVQLFLGSPNFTIGDNDYVVFLKKDASYDTVTAHSDFLKNLSKNGYDPIVGVYSNGAGGHWCHGFARYSQLKFEPTRRNFGFEFCFFNK